MSVLLIIAIVMAVWIGLCLLVLALCVSAKERDDEEWTLAADAVLEPTRRGARRRAAALS